MTRVLRQCAAIGRRDLALQRSYGASALLGMLAAVLGLVAYHYIGRLVGSEQAARLAGGSYFAFVWTGIMVQLLVASGLASLGGSLAREASEGTLEPLLAAGASPLALVVGGACAPLLLALLQIAVHAALGVPLFGLDLGAARAAPAAAALTATLVACAPIGLVAAAAWLRFRRHGAVTSASLFAFSAVGGIYFPVTLLPAPFDALASWVPVTAGLEVVRAALLEGAGWSAAAPGLARLALIAALGWPPSLWLLRAGWSHAQRRGALALA